MGTAIINYSTNTIKIGNPLQTIGLIGIKRHHFYDWVQENHKDNTKYIFITNYCGIRGCVFDEIIKIHPQADEDLYQYALLRVKHSDI